MAKEITEDYVGTCQACFGEFKVGDDGLMVLHGFKRPGDGYTHGNCLGYDHKPFEHDKALSEQILASHRKEIARLQKYLADLNGGQVDTLIRRWRELDRKTWTYTDKQEIVAPGHKLWDETLRSAIYRTESSIRFFTGLANYIEMRIAAWKVLPVIGLDCPPTGRVRGLAKAYDPIEAAAAEERAAAKAARDAKPGKLKLHIHWQSAVERTKCNTDAEWRDRYDRIMAEKKQHLDAKKAWAKATFEGKLIVKEGSTYDLPRDISSNDSENITIHIPWEYRDQIETMLPGARRFINDKKRIEYLIEMENMPA